MNEEIVEGNGWMRIFTVRDLLTAGIPTIIISTIHWWQLTRGEFSLLSTINVSVVGIMVFMGFLIMANLGSMMGELKNE